jgi:hypothetical protein
MDRLAHLRVFFVLYMLAKTIVDVVLGSGICLDSLEAGGIAWLIRFFGSHFAIPILAILSNGVLLLLGLVLFHFLLQKRNWARIILLIVGWFNVIDALSGILFHSQAARVLSHFTFGVDWDRILYLDRVTDILGLIYWGYLIYVLQVNHRVRKEFFGSSPEPVPDQK